MDKLNLNLPEVKLEMLEVKLEPLEVDLEPITVNLEPLEVELLGNFEVGELQGFKEIKLKELQLW